MKTLYLEKRGCDFFKGDEICNISNVGNYRVGSYDYSIKGKDGKDYIVEFCNGVKNKVRTENLRTGKPLKKPVVERVNNYCLYLNTQYESENGLCYRNLDIEKDTWNMNFDYTLENILKVVNNISVDKYDRIEFVN